MHRYFRIVLLLALTLQQLIIASAEAEDFKGLRSSYQCFEEHENYPEQRVCLFDNLVVHNNTIYYVSEKAVHLPQVVISWETKFLGDNLLKITSVTPDQLPTQVSEVQEVKEAGLFHQQHPINYYHLFTEITPTIHYTICKFLYRCNYQKHDQLRLFWVNMLTNPDGTRLPTYTLPTSIKDLLECLTPHPVKNIFTATVEEGKTLLLRKSAVGLPRHARFYHQKKEEWKARWQDPPPLEHMKAYRQRVSECLQLDIMNALAPTNPVRITLVNRHYEDGRHILNAERLRDRIRDMREVKALGNVEVNVVYLEGSLRTQAELIANTSIYIWAHGAAMAQTFFLPKGAQALEVVQWVVSDPSDQHVWVQGIKKAFGLNLGLDVLVNNDPTKVFFNYDVIRSPTSQYHKFNNTEKVMLLEELKCPTWQVESRGLSGMECFGWFHWHMSLKLEWQLLEPKVQQALANLLSTTAALRRPMPPGSLPGTASSTQAGVVAPAQQQHAEQAVPGGVSALDPLASATSEGGSSSSSSMVVGGAQGIEGSGTGSEQ